MQDLSNVRKNFISEEILHNNTEIAVITETWLKKKTLMKMMPGNFHWN